MELFKRFLSIYYLSIVSCNTVYISEATINNHNFINITVVTSQSIKGLSLRAETSQFTYPQPIATVAAYNSLDNENLYTNTFATSNTLVEINTEQELLNHTGFFLGIINYDSAPYT